MFIIKKTEQGEYYSDIVDLAGEVIFSSKKTYPTKDAVAGGILNVIMCLATMQDDPIKDETGENG